MTTVLVRLRLCRATLPPGSENFTFFLQSYTARWAGRAGWLGGLVRADSQLLGNGDAFVSVSFPID